MGVELIESYFPSLTLSQKEQFKELEVLYRFWNAQINVVSRKDIDLLFERHVLHSLGIATVLRFKPNTKILDVGTGGGFPGIPLAILFPESNFHLVDSIGKKIKVVEEVAKGIGLKNVFAEQARAGTIHDKFHFVVSRAVTEFEVFYNWVEKKFLKDNFNELKNGILYLKGGDLKEELSKFKTKIQLFNLNEKFKEEFFETKKVVYLPVK
jgi:16S rRNA (guanine527-N7)-methyltransferase